MRTIPVSTFFVTGLVGALLPSIWQVPDYINDYSIDERGFPIGVEGMSSGVKTKVQICYLDDNRRLLKMPFVYRVSKMER